MDIFLLVCGLALFLYGMDVMGNALKKSAGRKLKTILGNLTSSKFKAFSLGLIVTAVIQSSSATTVMVVGFVNSGTMLLSQAISVIMGANVGTAVTAWLTALNGIEGGAEATAWLKYLKPDYWMPILALIGICFIMFSKKDKKVETAADNAVAQIVENEAVQEDDLELIAVIAAAIAASEGAASADGYVVRSIRRIR